MRRKCQFIGLSVGLLVILLMAMYSYIKEQEHLAARYHLLCEVLKPGMSEDEVFNVLQQAGEVVVNGKESISPDASWYVVFTDSRGKDLYGAFNLGFYNNGYDRAYVSSFESIDVICDFRLKINIPSTTSNP